MSKSTITQEQTAEAVNDLLSRQELTDYFTELSLMHGAFIRSDFADDQRTRTTVTGTYENLRDFILTLKSIQSQKME